LDEEVVHYKSELIADIFPRTPCHSELKPADTMAFTQPRYCTNKHSAWPELPLLISAFTGTGQLFFSAFAVCETKQRF